MSPSFEKTAYCPFLAALAIFLSACGSKEEEAVPQAGVRPVKLLTLEAASREMSRRYPATIEAATSRDVSFSVGGLIVEVPVKEAEEIQEDAIIARIDSRDFQSQFDSAKAQFDNAEEEYQRAVRLASGDAIARSALEQRKSQRDVAKAQFESAQKALNDTILRSPISGVITKVFVSPLENVGAGKPVATVIAPDGLQATVNLPAKVVANIENRVDKSAFVLLDAAPSERIPAEFKEATLEADVATQTFGVTFTFRSPENLLILPGMNATMELSSSAVEVDGSAPKVAVPLGSVLSDGGAQYVWVVDSDSMAVSRREVEIEDSIGEMVVVLEGLSVGETIAAAGASYLSEGMLVRPWGAD